MTATVISQNRQRIFCRQWKYHWVLPMSTRTIGSTLSFFSIPVSYDATPSLVCKSSLPRRLAPISRSPYTFPTPKHSYDRLSWRWKTQHSGIYSMKRSCNFLTSEQLQLSKHQCLWRLLVELQVIDISIPDPNRIANRLILSWQNLFASIPHRRQYNVDSHTSAAHSNTQFSEPYSLDLRAEMYGTFTRNEMDNDDTVRLSASSACESITDVVLTTVLFDDHSSSVI